MVLDLGATSATRGIALFLQAHEDGCRLHDFRGQNKGGLSALEGFGGVSVSVLQDEQGSEFAQRTLGSFICAEQTRNHREQIFVEVLLRMMSC